MFVVGFFRNAEGIGAELFKAFGGSGVGEGEEDSLVWVVLFEGVHQGNKVTVSCHDDSHIQFVFEGLAGFLEVV